MRDHHRLAIHADNESGARAQPLYQVQLPGIEVIKNSIHEKSFICFIISLWSPDSIINIWTAGPMRLSSKSTNAVLIIHNTFPRGQSPCNRSIATSHARSKQRCRLQRLLHNTLYTSLIGWNKLFFSRYSLVNTKTGDVQCKPLLKGLCANRRIRPMNALPIRVRRLDPAPAHGRLPVNSVNDVH